MRLSDYPIRAILAVQKNLLERGGYSSLKRELQNIAQSIQEPKLNRLELSSLVNAGMQLRSRNLTVSTARLPTVLANDWNYGEMAKAANSVKRSADARAKALRVKEQVSSGKSESDPGIFFLCSWHQKPAEEHGALQGRVYVDRTWAATLRRRGWEFWIPTVERYIEEEKVMTVQDAIKGPHWLITRPNCRHYFVPLNFFETLNATHSELLNRHPEARMVHKRPLSDRQRYLLNKKRQRSVQKVLKAKV